MESQGKDVIVTIRKRRSGLTALWAAVRLYFKFRPNRLATRKVLPAPNEETKAPESNETTWKDIVGGIRPLHLQPLETKSPKVSLLPPPPPPFPNEEYYDVLMASPDNSNVGMSSRYASAEDLQALDTECDSDVINLQAEEFIAKFYEQIKMQRLESLYGNAMGIENCDC